MTPELLDDDSADAGELRDFVVEADHRVLLVADGRQTLGVGIDGGNFWCREGGYAEVVVPFGGADRRDLVADVPYRFVARNQGDGPKWEVAAELRVLRKP